MSVISVLLLLFIGMKLLFNNMKYKTLKGLNLNNPG